MKKNIISKIAFIITVIMVMTLFTGCGNSYEKNYENYISIDAESLVRREIKVLGKSYSNSDIEIINDEIDINERFTEFNLTNEADGLTEKGWIWFGIYDDGIYCNAWR